MEVALLVLFALGLVLVAPILAIMALVRISKVQSDIRDMAADLSTLESRLGGLMKSVAAERTARAAATPATSEAAAAPPSVAAPTPAPTATPTPALAVPTVAAPAAQPKAPVTPPAAVRPPVPPATAPSPGPLPPSRPPRSTPPPSPPSTPAFDWESLLGVRGAAWLGGVTIVIAGIFFARWAIDRGLITPELRIAILVLSGVSALVWAELSLRRGYATTANAVSGAGIAILYVAFFAAYSLYHLFPLALTFALMALVTVVAGLLAVRYDAMYTAVLGLMGGFATPILLSTGVDRPVGLFSYVLLLNLGLIAVARQKRWHGLVLLSLAGTLVIEVGWFGRFMAPEKMIVGLGAFLIFGLLYLFLPLVTEDQEQDTLVHAGTVGGLAPFLFAVLLAGQRAYLAEWPLLFGYLALLDAALIVVALLRGRVLLLVGAALATAVILPLWAGQGLSADALWGPTLAAVALTGLMNAPPRLARRIAPGVADEHGTTLEAAGLIGAAGLGLFAFVAVVRGFGEPPWVFGALVLALSALLLERTGEARRQGILPLGSGAIAILIQVWFFRSTSGEDLLRNLGLPLLFAIVLSLASARRVGRSQTTGSEDEGAVVVAVLVGLAGLFACLGSSELGSDPRPLCAALAVAVVLLVTSALRCDWTALVPLGLGAAVVFSTVWHQSYFRPSDLPFVLASCTGFFLAFLVLPFLVPPATARLWKARPLPWYTSALAGPAFFLVLYRAVTAGWGKAWIGALPVVIAALTVAALAGVGRIFPAARADAEGERLRLRYLALFAAVALGFVAVAIPLQLDKQWITVGWALEAAAVWWLYLRLPHPGLLRFGALLFVFVGVRLLFNWEVLRYQERGLPVLNWLLYTYGIPACACFAGAFFLRRAGAREGGSTEIGTLRSGASFLGLLLVFWLVNLEIFDYFSEGRYLEVSFERRFARDLTLSAAWGLYAMVLLVLGLWRRHRALRFVSLGFLILTVAKVFLYDLAALEGLYRILSFLGLGVSLIVVSLLYQRFVLAREPAP